MAGAPAQPQGRMTRRALGSAKAPSSLAGWAANLSEI